LKVRCEGGGGGGGEESSSSTSFPQEGSAGEVEREVALTAEESLFFCLKG